MSNPEALQAIMDIQSGMERLRTAAPDVFNSMGLPSLPPGLTAAAASAAAASSSGASTTTSTTTTAATSPAASTPTPASTTSSSATSAPAAAAGTQPEVFSQFLSQVSGSMIPSVNVSDIKFSF